MRRIIKIGTVALLVGWASAASAMSDIERNIPVDAFPCDSRLLVELTVQNLNDFDVNCTYPFQAASNGTRSAKHTCSFGLARQFRAKLAKPQATGPSSIATAIQLTSVDGTILKRWAI